MPPCWCFPGDFLKFAKLISSLNFTKYRSLKIILLITFWHKATSKEKNI